MTNWQHPELGNFKFEDTGWITQHSFPVFKPFIYRWHGRHVGQSKIKLAFEAEDESQFPTKQSIAVALRVIRNIETLAKRIQKAVWDDLNGNGEDSGMWWHGDRNTINQMIDAAFHDRKRKPFDKPDDIYHLIGGCRICRRLFIRHACVNVGRDDLGCHSVALLRSHPLLDWAKATIS